MTERFSDYSCFRDAAVGITGHRGVLGRLLYERLRANDVAVEAYEGDINHAATLQEWFRRRSLRFFFHFAAIVPIVRVDADPIKAYETNVIGAFNVCREILRTQPQCWLFHASSSHVYRPTSDASPIPEDAELAPQTFYGVTKLAAERVIEPLLQRMSAPYCIGRIFSFSHETQQEPYLVPSLRKRIAELRDGETLTVTNPSAVRDIQDAEGIIDCILHLASKQAVGIVNIGTGVGTSVRQIAARIARELNKNIRIDGVDRDMPGALIADTSKLQHLLSK
ncbi:MAG TPA: NAD(P)-dependent oxidoreductase [Steroidobacteraceae bacterium]